MVNTTTIKSVLGKNCEYNINILCVPAFDLTQMQKVINYARNAQLLDIFVRRFYFHYAASQRYVFFERVHI